MGGSTLQFKTRGKEIKADLQCSLVAYDPGLCCAEDDPQCYRVVSDPNVARTQSAPGTCCLVEWHALDLAASDGSTVYYTLMPISG